MSQQPFIDLASVWWDKNGPFHTLHDINPVRLSYIESFVDLTGKRVLDLGCGGGILTESLAQKAKTVVGLDLEPSLIHVASEHAKNNHLTIDYQAGDFFKINFSKKFDVIVCMEMLEHVENPQKILATCYQNLKEGGYIFLSTINRGLKAYFETVLMGEYILKLLPKQTHEYQSFIKPSELHTFLELEGFELVDLQGMSYNPWTRQAKTCRSVEVNYMMVARKI